MKCLHILLVLISPEGVRWTANIREQLHYDLDSFSKISQDLDIDIIEYSDSDA